MHQARVFAGLGVAASAAAVVAGLSVVGYSPPAATAAAAQYAPQNKTAPSISDNTPSEGQTLSANTGTWDGAPTDINVDWQRCDANGNNCSDIAEGTTYKVAAADVGKTLRVEIEAKNASGVTFAFSPPTGIVAKGGTTSPPSSTPGGAKKLSNGETSVPASAVAFGGQRLVISDVRFTPNPVRSRFSPITVRVKVTDTRGYVVRDALVFLRSTPVVTTTPPERRTGEDGWVTLVTYPERDLVIKPGYSIQFFVRARKDGENALAGISTRRLVQVAMAR